jgi:hypothetical protein
MTKGRGNSRYSRLLVYFSLSLLMCVSFVEGADIQRSEEEVKAAFIHHFCAYVTWPEPPADSRFAVGISASRKTARILKKTLEEKSNSACQFNVHFVSPGDDLKNIHILYATQDGQASIADFRALAGSQAILTISEDKQMPTHGVINFVIRDDYVRFQISKSHADEIGLKLSSQLLEVAVQVD